MTAALSRLAEPAADAAITAATKTLQLPTIRAQFGQLAGAAAKQRLSHKAFLAEVLTAECDEREARRRIRLVNEAKFPRTKRLADFDHTRIPDITPAALGHLASGAWIDKGEPLVLLGEPGTGKTHLAIGLAIRACQAGHRVLFAPPANGSTNSPTPTAADACRPNWPGSAATRCWWSTRSATSPSNPKRRTCFPTRLQPV
jgi:DNA replication protein DnaC